ncbi:hypothetical protein RB653_007234 [Dictyostelium firmibasis]|uniref:Rab-GAP TBC domain-containing protein n=1 Tax=Dictyostelium firmibasis TaxID=79012 RepID=A0AAN7YR20_9MYCE
MWIIPRPNYSASSLWTIIFENQFFQLLKTKPNDSLLGKLANLAVVASDQYPLTYRIIYKSKPQQIIAVSNSLDIIKDHWNFLIQEIIPKILQCDDVKDQFVITKISGMANCGVEEEEDQNDQHSLKEFKTQFDIDEKLVTCFICTLPTSINVLKPTPGKMFITVDKICFYTSNPPTRIMIPFFSVNSITKENTLGFIPSAIKIKACIGPDEKTVSEFSFHFILRDQAFDMLEQLWQYTMDQLYEETNGDSLSPPSSINTDNRALPSSSSFNDLQSIDSNNVNNNNLISSPILKPKTKQFLNIEKKNKDFQRVFKLPMDEELIQVHACWIVRNKNSLLGEVYISPNFICIKYKERFTAKKFTTVIHVSQVESIHKLKPFLGISVLTESLVITVISGRSITLRLFHCNEALDTMRKYCTNLQPKQRQQDEEYHPYLLKQPESPNFRETLRLETIGTNLYTQEPSIILEDEKIEKRKFEMWDNYFKKNGMDTTMSITRRLTYLTHLGIPEFFRGHIWSFASGACFMWEKEKGYYDNLIKVNDEILNDINSNNASPTLQTITTTSTTTTTTTPTTTTSGSNILSIESEKITQAIEDIEKDVRRTFSHHPYFKDNGPGVDSLRRVLIAYSRRNPNIGYCQGMNNVTGLMLLYMKEEAAFWVLSKVVELYLCDYYSKEMIGSIVDQNIFIELCQEYLPEVFKHLERIGLPVQILSTPWFICLFISYIPYPVATRVIDCLFLDGTTVLFQVGLAILKINKNAILAETESEVVVELVRNKKYDIDELIDVTFQDFDNLDEKIKNLRNSHKFSQIRKNHRIKMKSNSSFLNQNSQNNSETNSPTTQTITQ